MVGPIVPGYIEKCNIIMLIFIASAFIRGIQNTVFTWFIKCRGAFTSKNRCSDYSNLTTIHYSQMILMVLSYNWLWAHSRAATIQGMVFKQVQ